MSKDAVDDEVDRAVDGDEEIVGLCERMILIPSMLQSVIKLIFFFFFLQIKLIFRLASVISVTTLQNNLAQSSAC